jgi:two-component system sensor histidine kinase YesM
MNKKGETTVIIAWIRNFLLLVLLPILIVGFIAMFVVRDQIKLSSANQIEIAQANFISVLDNSINRSELQLSQLLFANEETLLIQSDKYFRTKDNISEQYEIRKNLQTIIDFVLKPFSNLEGINIHSKDDEIFWFGSDFEKSLDYKSMVSWKKSDEILNRTYADVYKSDERDDQLFVTICIKLDDEKYASINKVCYYVLLPVPEIVKDYGRNDSLGSLYLFDGKENLILSRGKKIDGNIIDKIDLSKSSGVFTENNKQLLYFTNKSSTVALTAVSVVDLSVLLSPYSRLIKIILSVIIVILILLSFYLFSFYKNLIKPINALVDGMKDMEEGDWITPVKESGYVELKQLTASFNSLKVGAKKSRDYEKENLNKLHELEILALQTQVNPHFIVNCMESIKFMAQLSHYETMEKLAESLIKIVSASFRKANGDYTLKEELEVLDSFVFITKLKNIEEFKINYDVQEDLENVLVPRLFLQPFVDNAIQHGYSDEEQFVINIKISLASSKRLCVQIEDTGVGMSEQQIQEILNRDPLSNGLSIGICNIKERLNLRYDGDFTFNIKSKINKGSSIYIEFPALFKRIREKS